MEFLIDKMKKHKSNEEFFDFINKKGGAAAASGSQN
jgi:transcription termination factor Rho